MERDELLPKLPKNFTGAVREKLRYIEKYACVSDLVNHSPLLKHFPSPDSNILLNYNDSDGDTSSENKRFFHFMFQPTDSDSTYREKWKALRHALCSPGQELLFYILNEKDDRNLQVLEKRVELVCGTYRKELLVGLDGNEFCNRFNFNNSHREKIQCKIKEEGNQAGNVLILKFIVKYMDWFPNLLQLLGELGLRELAEDLRKNDPELTATDSPATNTRSSKRPPLPMVDDPDQAAHITDAQAREIRSDDMSGAKDYSISTFTSSPRLTLDRKENPPSPSLAGSLSGSNDTCLNYTDLFVSARSDHTDLSAEMGLRPDNEFYACKDNDFDHEASSVEHYSGLYPQLEDVYEEHTNSSDYGENGGCIGFHLIHQQRKQEEEQKKSQALQDRLLKQECIPLKVGKVSSEEKEADAPYDLQCISSERKLTSQENSEIPVILQCEEDLTDLTLEEDYPHSCSKTGIASGSNIPSEGLEVSLHTMQNNSRQQSRRQAQSDMPVRVRPAVFHCQLCSAAFLSAEVLKDHNCSKAIEKPLNFTTKCHSNDYTSFQHKTEKHMRRNEVASTAVIPAIFRCTNCPKAFFSAEDREQHRCSTKPTQQLFTTMKPAGDREQHRCTIASTAVKPAIFRCKNCPKTFFSAEDKEQHRCSTKPPKQLFTAAGKQPSKGDRCNIPVSPTVYRCKLCQKPFLSKAHLEKHSCLKAPERKLETTFKSHNKVSFNASHKKLERQPRWSERCDIPSSAGVIFCQHCSKPFFKKERLENHKCSKTPPK